MDMNGFVVASTGSLGSGPGQFNFPNGIRLSKDSEIFVCDTNNHRIQVFYKYLESWGDMDVTRAVSNCQLI